MSSTELINFISSNYFRIGIALFLILGVIVFNLIRNRLKKEANKISKGINILFFLIILGLLASLLFTSTLEIDWITLVPTFEVRVIGVMIALTVLLIINGIRIVKKKKASKVIRIINIVISILILITVLLTFFIRPHVIRTTPTFNSTLTKADPTIEVEFEIPVDYKNIKFNLSPEVDGEWQWEAILEGTVLKRKAIFVPSESFYPGTPIIVYVTGIKAQWWQPKAHEHSIEFKGPVIPEFVESSPKNEEENVSVQADMVLEFDSQVGEFVDIQAEFSPPLEYDYVNHANNQIIRFKEPLEQDKTYTATIYRTERSYDTKTHEDIIRGDTAELSTFSFTTVSTPLLESYSPKGDTVLPAEEIKIVFDQSMDRESVEENLSVIPEIEYTLQWEDSNMLYIKPVNPLEKATKYSFTIAKDAYSDFGGMIGTDINFGFTTIGYVKVNSFSPVSGATGLEPSTTNITIAFNQEVDKESAQSLFTIYPNISGSFTWDGNSMTYISAGKLEFSTKYVYTVGKGVKSINGLDSKDAFSSSFVTRDNIFSINVPYYSQQEGFTCNIAATRMALAYYGIYRSESSIKSGIGIGTNPNADWVAGYGVHAGPVAGYINSQGRSATVKSNWNVPDMLYEVKAGNPVIIWEYNRFSTPAGAYTLSSGYTAYKGMHSEVIRGYIGNANNPYYILTNDPWRGQLTYSRGTFDSIWSYLGNTAIVVK